MFFFLKVFVSVGPVLMSAGRWQKFTFGQIRDESTTSTKCLNFRKEVFVVWVYTYIMPTSILLPLKL